MDFLLDKAIVIGVGILVTIAIASGVMIAVNQVVQIYGYVNQTDISVKGRFNEFSAYDNTIKTGADVLNTAKKYELSSAVRVVYKDSSGNQIVINEESKVNSIEAELNTVNRNGPTFRYVWKYKASFIPESQTSDGVTVITFQRV